MSRRKKKAGKNRGPPFVEIAGELFINMAFDMTPLGDDIRLRITAEICPDVPANKLMLLRALTAKETRLVRQCRRDADVEAWSQISGTGS